MKVALLFPNNKFTAPYLKYYTDILEKQDISYDLIIWDRGHKEENNCIAFKSSESNNSKVSKVLDFLRFKKFIIANLKKTKYAKIIIFTGQLGVFLSSYLIKNYKNNYVLDVRDFSKTIDYFQGRFKKLVSHADFVTISSNGFKEWLPKSHNYVLGHNTNIDLINKRLAEKPLKTALFQNDKIQIDTIGQIKDFRADSKFVDRLKNDSRFYMNFIGFGISLERLKEHARENNISNLSFYGAYKKEEEENLLKNTDLINILITLVNFNKGPSLLSNRLYLSALMNIPCIVNANTEQSRIIKKYDFGIIVENHEELPDKIIAFKKSYDKTDLEKNCTVFLNDVKNDLIFFQEKVKLFLNKI